MDHTMVHHLENPMIKKTFKIPDMSCSNCAMKLESLEDTLDGVKEVDASYHRLEMVIVYDENKLTEEQIITAVKKKGTKRYRFKRNEKK